MLGDRLATRFDRKVVELLPGIDLEALDQARLKRRQEARSGTFVLLHPGTLCARKNQLFSVQLLADLIRERAFPMELWLAGGTHDTEYKEKVVRAIARENLSSHVRLLGWREDVPELIAEVDALVLPSLDEGIPNAVQEAMYIGTPVVTSEVGGLPELLDENRGAALPLNRHRWVQAIHALITQQDRGRSTAEKVSDWAARRFSMDRWGHDYAGVLREVIREKGGLNE